MTLRIYALIVAVVGVLAFSSNGLEQFFEKRYRFVHSHLTNEPVINKTEVSVLLGRRFASGTSVPQAETIKGSLESVTDGEENLHVEYSIDSHLQEKIRQTLKKARAEYASVVVMDAKTGQVLTMISHGLKNTNMALRSNFPAASIFKVVTAASAIETGVLKANSIIPVRGGYHTLYKQNVLKAWGLDPQTSPRFVRKISFGEALAKSVNSVFGKVGIFGVGAEGLRDTANRFYFDRAIPFEMPIDQSVATIPNDDFGLAESASGYTRLNTLSPLHGALIAAAVANNGLMPEPSIVQNISNDDGKQLYYFKPQTLSKVFEKDVSDQVARMMNQTITNGTSQWAFRGWNHSIPLSSVFLGGKTGTLNGWDPPGRYDWFVGFGNKGDSRIAVSVLCIHPGRKKIKASQVARIALETYFSPVVARQSTSHRTTRDEI